MEEEGTIIILSGSHGLPFWVLGPMAPEGPHHRSLEISNHSAEGGKGLQPELTARQVIFTLNGFKIYLAIPSKSLMKQT